MEIKELEKAGLTKNQSLVYLSLLKRGSTGTQNIIKDSGLHRSRVYDSLEILIKMGLVSYVIKGFKKYFQASSPENLLKDIDEKRMVIENLLPKLKQLENTEKEEINASIYKGKEGLKTIHLEMLKENGDIYVLNAKGLIFEELPYFIPNFEKERIKKRIKFICLFDNENIKNKLIKKPLFKGKVLPKDIVSNSVVNIFGNKVAIVLWKEKYPTGFMINNKEIADSFRKWFKLIYKFSK